MLVNSKLHREFWAEAIITVVYLKNLLPTSLKKGTRRALDFKKIGC